MWTTKEIIDEFCVWKAKINDWMRTEIDEAIYMNVKDQMRIIYETYTNIAIDDAMTRTNEM